VTKHLPTCPLCQSDKVRIIGVSGLDGRLTVLRCDQCEKEWSEALAQLPRESYASTTSNT
jgi:hypothetical protein